MGAIYVKTSWEHPQYLNLTGGRFLRAYGKVSNESSFNSRYTVKLVLKRGRSSWKEVIESCSGDPLNKP